MKIFICFFSVLITFGSLFTDEPDEKCLLSNEQTHPMKDTSAQTLAPTSKSPSPPEKKNQFLYLKGGKADFMPTIGAGIRIYKNDFAFDGSIQVSGIFIGYFCAAKGMVLYYPMDSIYIGVGPGFWSGNSVYGKYPAHITAEQVIGLEWKDMFLQAEFTEPSMYIDSIIPAVSIGVGF